jgi:hypothetical protein
MGADDHARSDHYEKLFGPLRQGDLDLGALAEDAPAPPGAGAEPQPVPLTWTEAWRIECEARYMMTLPLEARRAHYRGVGEKRGEAAMKELVAEVKRLWALVNSI